MQMVEALFAQNFAALEDFGWPVTRSEALAAFNDFLQNGLPNLGDYQIAMKTDAPSFYHWLIAPAINIGLLSPREVCLAAEAAWQADNATLECGRRFHPPSLWLSGICAWHLLGADAG